MILSIGHRACSLSIDCAHHLDCHDLSEARILDNAEWSDEFRAAEGIDALDSNQKDGVSYLDQTGQRFVKVFVHDDRQNTDTRFVAVDIILVQ